MIAMVHAITIGPWPGDNAPDLDGFRDAVDILLAMSRRIDEETASSDDLRRYRLACSAAERIARSRNLPRLAIDAASLTAALGEIRSVYPPPQLAHELPLWCRKLSGSGIAGTELAAFLREAQSANAGVVLTVQPIGETIPLRLDTGEAIPVQRRPRQPRPELAEAIAMAQERSPLPFTGDKRRMTQATALRRQIVQALRDDMPVPIGMAAPHDVITEVLRELQNGDIPKGAVRLVQVDGSESAPFPVGLPLFPARTPERTIRLGFVSVRHMTLDIDIASYWFRNRLVSVPGRTLAETEEVCYRDTLQRLRELSDCRIDHVELVHTGFEPAVIGFYRAASEYACEHNLTVTPLYMRKSGYISGTPWLAAA